MSQKAIITDLNKCVGCVACVVGCKTANEVPIGKFRNSVYRIGPTPKFEGAQMPVGIGGDIRRHMGHHP